VGKVLYWQQVWQAVCGEHIVRTYKVSMSPGFHREVDENCAYLGNYTMYCCNSLSSCHD